MNGNREFQLRRRVLFAAFAFLVAVFTQRFSTATFADEGQKNQAGRCAVFRGVGAGEDGVSDISALALLQVLDAAPDLEARFVSPQEIQNGALKDYDVVVFPGGSASAQRQALGDEGWKALREFLFEGGGYYGTCAGAYMALVNLSRSEGRLINAELQEGEWERGEAILDIELTEEGKKMLGDVSGVQQICYANGPIFHPANYDDLPPYKILAVFRSEVALNNAPKGVQMNSPAIAVGSYGKGRVVISSPHPELTPNLNWLAVKLARYAAGK